MDIIFKHRDFIVVNKPAGIPSQSDLSGDKDAMTLASETLKVAGENDKLWLIHRLDRVVGGLLVFARCRESAAIFSSLVSSNKLEKGYLAVVEGRAEGGLLKDYIYKDSAASKAYITDRKRAGVKEALLSYSQKSALATENGERSLVDISLITGRFHQIRAQFSSRKMSLVGDKKYGSRDTVSRMPALFAYRLSFEYKGKKYKLTSSPDITTYPWNLFSEETYEGI